MKNSTLFILLFVLVNSCMDKKHKEEKQNVIHLENQTEEIFQIDPRRFEENELTLIDFAADVKYVTLSNTVRLGLIRKIKVTRNAIYLVSDKSRGGEGNGYQELFRFDKNGQNPVQIGRIGKGPKEYLSSEYFAVDEQNSRIYISGKINIVLVFDTLGNYVRQFKFQNPNQKFANLEYFGANILFVPEQKRGAAGPHLWSVIDTLGNILSSKVNTATPFQTRMGARSGTFKFNNEISYWVDYNDTIFAISPDLSYKPAWIITPGEHRKPKKDLPFTLDLPEKLKEFYAPHYFFETNNYLISQYNYKGKFAYVFISKVTHKTSISTFEWKKDTKGGIPNNFDGGLTFSPETYFTDDENEFLAGTIQPYQLKAHIASDEFKNSTPQYPEKKKELEQLANSLDENDNPVLMLVKLKE